MSALTQVILYDPNEGLTTIGRLHGVIGLESCTNLYYVLELDVLGEKARGCLDVGDSSRQFDSMDL